LKFKLLFALGVVYALSSYAGKPSALDEQKTAVVDAMVGGCATSLVKPNINKFMAKAAAAGKPFPNEDAARRALAHPEMQAQAEKMLPAANAMCRCTLDSPIQKIMSAKTNTEVETIAKNIEKPEPATLTDCAKKHLPALGTRDR
jgi:hypothetical protein